MNPCFAFYFTAVVSSGWLCGSRSLDVARRTGLLERGIGNGISITSFCWYRCGTPPAIAHILSSKRQGDPALPRVLLLVAVLVFADVL